MIRENNHFRALNPSTGPFITRGRDIPSANHSGHPLKTFTLYGWLGVALVVISAANMALWVHANNFIPGF